MSCLFLSPPTYRLNSMTSTSQIVSQIKSQDFIDYIEIHFITISPLTYVTNGIHDFAKCCIRSSVHLDL